MRGQVKKILFKDYEIGDIIDSHVDRHELLRSISERYGCSAPVIRRVLMEQGVYQPIGARKYFFDEDYFAQIDTPRKAYWLGLFFADGNVNKGKFQLSFKREDRYILEMLADDVKWDGNIYDSDVKLIYGRDRDERVYLSSKIVMCSRRFVDHLYDKGVVPNKTFRLTFPKIDRHLRKHLIRGLFDGDGCISVIERGTRTDIMFGIVGQEELLEDVNSIIAKEVGVKPAKIRQKTDENCWEFRYASSMTNNVRRFDKDRLDDILAIREWLYKDACIFFRRKRLDFYSIEPLPRRSGLSVPDAAKLIGVDTRTMRDYVSKCKIPSYMEGMYRRIAVEEIENFKHRGRRKGRYANA
jgi:hypothetical protein